MKPTTRTALIQSRLDARNPGWPDREIHTVAEQDVIYGIRKKVALYEVKLIQQAERAGKLPGKREFFRRMGDILNRQIFGAKKCPKLSTEK